MSTVVNGFKKCVLNIRLMFYLEPHMCLDFFIVLFSFFRGGKICMTDHFKPLWARNVPKFGIGHAMALGVSQDRHIFYIN